MCETGHAPLTTLQGVLELVWASHKPLGAYDILGVLSEEDGRRAAPPTVYRALDFPENGLVHASHRSMPSSAACTRASCTRAVPHLQGLPCGHRAGAPAISQSIVAGAVAVGFAVRARR